MSEPLVGVVLAHDRVASALIGAVAVIAGDDHGLVAVSNTGCDREAITRRIQEALTGRPGVIFTDLPGGSCGFGASAYARTHPHVAVVTGVNLPMLLDFAFHRAVEPDQARVRAVEAGRAAIASPGAG